MLVSDVMETDLVVCDAEGTLRDAVGRMLEAHVGSVIVLAEGTPTGIVTETDALKAGYAAEQPLGEIPIQAVASDSLVTVEPDRTIRAAIQLMAEEGIKKLPVIEDLDLIGIVTMTDITRHYGDIVREIHEIEQTRETWSGDAEG